MCPNFLFSGTRVAFSEGFPSCASDGAPKILKRKAWDFFADVSRREDIATLGFLDGDPFSCADLGSLGEAVQRGVTLQDAIETTFLGNSSAIALPSSLLAREPVTRSRKSKTRPSAPAPAPSITDSLQQVLASLLDHQCLPNCEEAAEMLGAHRRTLLRALQKEGLTYRHLVERVRFAAARRLLRQDDLSIGEIAHRLGY